MFTNKRRRRSDDIRQYIFQGLKTYINNVVTLGFFAVDMFKKITVKVLNFKNKFFLKLLRECRTLSPTIVTFTVLVRRSIRQCRCIILVMGFIVCTMQFICINVILDMYVCKTRCSVTREHL